MKDKIFYYKIKSFSDELLKSYPKFTEREPLIKKLYDEKDREKRKEIYLKVCEYNPEVYDILYDFLSKVKSTSEKEGHRHVYDWVADLEEDPIKWTDLFKEQGFKSAISNFSKEHSDTKKKDMGISEYYFWDYWFKDRDKGEISPYTYHAASNFEESLQIAREFYVFLGLEEYFDLIHFIKKEDAHTCASINYKDGKWTNDVTLSEAGVGSKVGSLQYIACIIHEVAHIVQVRQITDPDKNYFLPHTPLSEIVSIFFQRLYFDEIIQNHLGESNDELKIALKTNESELKENLIRQTHYFELESEMYNLLEFGEFNRENLDLLNRKTKRKYYGFDESSIEDHSWLRFCHYLCVPYRNRAYILGDILSEMFYQAFRKELRKNPKQANKKLRKMLVSCSKKGINNTWEDYRKMLSIKPKIDINFITDQMAYLLG